MTGFLGYIKNCVSTRWFNQFVTCWPVDAPVLLEVKSIQPFKRGKNGTIAELPPTEMIGYLLKQKVANNTLSGFSTKNCNDPGGDWNPGVYTYISKIFYPPLQTNMTKENPPFEDVFLIEGTGGCSSNRHVSELRGVAFTTSTGSFIKVSGPCYASCWAKKISTTSQRPWRAAHGRHLFLGFFFVRASRTEQKNNGILGVKNPQGFFEYEYMKTTKQCWRIWGCFFFCCADILKIYFLGWETSVEVKIGMIDTWRWLKSLRHLRFMKPSKNSGISYISTG